MNGSAGNKASGAPGKPERSETVLSLSTVHRMLPLVQRIVDDILRNQKSLERLVPEQDRLDRKRRSLPWPERQRRYQVREDVTIAERDLQEALTELQILGVSLLDPELGRVGFPTMVNNRRAYFSWRPGDEGLRHWHFIGENVCRTIPAAWMKEISLSSKN
jgi:hypothetical protein